MLALVTSGMIATSAFAMPAMAMAVEPSGENDGTNGTGLTDVTVQLDVSDSEFGGTSEPSDSDYYNPDEDNDGYGDNIAFSVPTSINFVSDVKGVLTGPSASATYIQNHSAFSIHASSFKVDAENGWNIVDDGTSPEADNSVDFQFGPEAAQIDAYDYLTKTAVPGASAASWNMAANNGKVELTTSGNIFNVQKDITEQSKFATIHTYVTAGNAVNA